MNKGARVIVGMSGGVDSSLSAWVLKQLGYRVEGLFMKNWEEDDGTEYCTALADLADARQVAESLGIPLHTANFSAEYWDRVFEHFLAEYRAGRTPNPDILCNREIKFRAFLDYALTLGADFIATGHYAQLLRRGTQTWLARGADQSKDQSYFLHAVSGSALARTLFPLGGMRKPEVRRLARQLGLITHDKKDSTGICFIGERRFRDFLKQYIPAQPGDIVTLEGEVIGRHEGLMYYTCGQRQGLGIGGLADHEEVPWYVADKDLSRNALIVVQGGQHPRLLSRKLSVSQWQWVSGAPPATHFSCVAKGRYRQPDQRCDITLTQDGRGEVQFKDPQRAMTPGQSLVCYDGIVCLGGGIIETVQAEENALLEKDY